MAKYRIYINEGGTFGLGGACGVIYIGYSEDGATEITVTQGRVIIPCTDEQFNIWQREIKKYTVLHVEAEKEGKDFHVTQVLENDAPPTENEKAFLEEQKRPVIFTDDVFGTFTKNKRLGWFEGEFVYNGKRFELMLDTAEDIATLHRIGEDLDGFLQKASAYAAEELLDLANSWGIDDWMMDGHEEEDYIEVTHEDFVARLTLESMGFTEDGGYNLWYDDGDLFLGHSIHIEGNLKDGFTDANMEG